MRAEVLAPKRFGTSMARELKFRPPSKSETMGIMMSETRLETILPKDPPIRIPTANSRTLPRFIKAINSLAIAEDFSGI